MAAVKLCRFCREPWPAECVCDEDPPPFTVRFVPPPDPPADD